MLACSNLAFINLAKKFGDCSRSAYGLIGYAVRLHTKKPSELDEGTLASRRVLQDMVLVDPWKIGLQFS